MFCTFLDSVVDSKLYLYILNKTTILHTKKKVILKLIFFNWKDNEIYLNVKLLYLN